MLIAAPVFRIGFRHINDGTTSAVDAHRLGEDTRALAFAYIKGVELSHQVALDGGCPLLIGSLRHLNGFNGLATQPVFVNTYSDFLRIIGSKE